VDRLATAISEGAYPLDPDRIADVLFRDGQDFSR
jgi:anti-sigma28 factor (negative regulator of flagellin synthesis)